MKIDPVISMTSDSGEENPLSGERRSDLGGCPGLGSGAEGHEAWSGRSLEQRASRRPGAEARSRRVVTEEHSRDHAGDFASLEPNRKG